MQEQYNEIELLILVTPELAEAVNACDMPPGGPGLNTTSPSDCELYLKGHLEVPICNPAGRGAAPSPQWSMPASVEPASAGVVLPAGGAVGGATGGTVIPEPVDAPLAPLPAETSGRLQPQGGMTPPSEQAGRAARAQSAAVGVFAAGANTRGSAVEPAAGAAAVGNE